MSDLELNMIIQALQKAYRAKVVVQDVEEDFIKEYSNDVLAEVQKAIRICLVDYEYTKLYFNKKQ